MSEIFELIVNLKVGDQILAFYSSSTKFSDC